jgi:5'-nucleotidase
MGLVASALGNHEFDAGPAEVLRLQNGGCASTRPAGACRFAPGFKGAGFTYLAANVVDRATGKTLVPASRIVDVKGVKVGLIGAVLQGTPKHAPPSATQGLDFLDEATSINAELAPLRAQGATAFVVLLHEGGTAKEAFDQPDCSTLAGPVVDIVKKLDPAIRLVISAHSHFGYLCRVDGRLVTQAGSAGHLLTRITLHVDPATRQVAGVDARNVVMDPAVFAPDAPLAAYLDEVEQRSAAVLNRTVARIAGPVDMRQNGAGEAPLGGLVADAMLAATRAQGAVLAMVNLGGIRRELETRPGGAVSFAQAQAVLPFGDHLVTMDLTGAQLYAILEQQWDRPADDHPNVLQLSQGAAYRWNPGQAPGRRVLPGSLQLNGVPVDMGKTYRVVTNDYLAEGGSNFPAFKLGTARTDTRIADLDAFIAYLAAHPQVGSGAWAAAAPRIRTAP